MCVGTHAVTAEGSLARQPFHFRFGSGTAGARDYAEGTVVRKC